MRILILTKYGELGASSRMRTIQYTNYLNIKKIETQYQYFITDQQLKKKYVNGKYSLLSLIASYLRRFLLLININTNYDVLWIEKELMPWIPAWAENLLIGRIPYVLDYDDALFHNYDLHKNKLIRFFYGKKLDILMNKSALVIAGNSYLAQRAIDAGAKNVEIIPTVIDIDRYPLNTTQKKSSELDNIIRIVWIGSPSTIHYLSDIQDVLQSLTKKINFELHVIGAPSSFLLEGVKVKVIQWTEDTEISNIICCDIGVMPLRNTPWELGKCGYKLIQYMACSLPTVASAIGANNDIVIENETGFLAHTHESWLNALEILALNKELRKKLGNKGRERVEKNYCIQVTSPILTKLLQDIASKG